MHVSLSQDRRFAVLLVSLAFCMPVAAQDVRPNLPPTSMTIEGQSYNVVQQRDPSARVPSFNKTLASKGMAPLSRCTLVVDLPVGTASGNHSFGGLCEQGSGSMSSRVMVCNDEMIGHFALEPIRKHKATLDDLAHFVAKHCYGG